MKALRPWLESTRVYIGVKLLITYNTYDTHTPFVHGHSARRSVAHDFPYVIRFHFLATRRLVHLSPYLTLGLR